jgi:peptidoglycan-associated lipoprotein
MSIRQSVILGLLAAFLAGCSQPTVPDPDAQSSAAPSDDSMSEQAPMDDDGMGGGEFFDDDEAAMTMIIYFDFDKSELRAEYADVLARHASGLSNSSRTSLRLEGHTDERGSREYNIGLGERRSQSVRRMLLIQGASTDQISTVSFGEERPAAFGSDEDAFQQNRRVEIKYTN